MKVILSRKGFDTKNGGIPSPFFEDGTMISFPIPSTDEYTYQDFVYDGMEYAKILKDLHYKGNPNCHPDPDLDQSRRKSKCDGWVPAFGQINASATYLKNIGVEVGDLFLFFGNFHCVTNDNGTIKYIRNSGDFYKDNDIQVIWGYLQVGEILDSAELQRKLIWHPHSYERRTSSSTNLIFKAADTLSFDPSKPGAGLLSFDEKRVLTLYGCSKATWKWNEVYDPEHIYSKRKNSANDPRNGIYYSGVWQELGLKESDKCTEWAKAIISDKKEETTKGNVLLTAEHHNWGMQCVDDWHKTLYILRNDGNLTIVSYEGETITEYQKKISNRNLSFIRSHIEEYMDSAERIDACDGTAWEIQHGFQLFELGYVYGTVLEKITDILYAAGK